MKLSRKSDYALRALFTLVKEYGRDPISIRVLAEINDIPKRFLEQIVLEMNAKGWVTSVPGRHGGILLAQPPEQITLGQVVRHFDGILAPIGCVSVTEYEPCSQESKCHFRRVLLDIRNYAAQLMDNATLRQVAQQAVVRRDEVFNWELMNGAGI